MGRAGSDDEERAVMTLEDKFRHKAQELRGRIKRNAGEVSGDRRLEAEGSADEFGGKVKQVGDRIKDAFRGRGTRRRY
jgi:uncharacterized protein YjbJ (UPF0337 family)